MDKVSFREEWYSIISESVPEELQLKCYDALFRYAFYGEPVKEKYIRALLALMLRTIDRDKQKAEELNIKRAEAGRKGGLVTASKSIPIQVTASKSIPFQANGSKSKQNKQMLQTPLETNELQNVANCSKTKQNKQLLQPILNINELGENDGVAENLNKGKEGEKKKEEKESFPPHPLYKEKEYKEKEEEESEKNAQTIARAKTEYFVSRNPPTLEQVQAYVEEKNLGMDYERFYDHFVSNGWKVSGRAPMKDWKAAARNWARNERLRYGTNYNNQRTTSDTFFATIQEAMDTMPD